ncbi:hypothetical protein C3Y98_04725 [Methylotenera oryzisoli]|uniref:Uncharacterized protein n=1 Tax=Methylotenera oryzisoli TaxID=2080758 RepID=A0A4Y9VSC1_9PROT|nr:hypothetical protein [Methylotenera oryzisoli]TFW71413.1 hypothetical protein C3Y98_04725 [Methylotenera oryzisoli]
MKLIIILTGLISFLIKLVLDLPLMLLGLLVIAIALPFRKNNHLPAWAEWCWGNRDHGNDGESFWAKRTIGWPYFIRCWWWLAVRNPTFNWSKYVLGLKVTQLAVSIGNTTVDEDEGATGWHYSIGDAFEFRFIGWPYTVFGKHFCVKLRFGWKIEGKDIGEMAQFCFVPNPVCAFTPKT